MTPAGRALLVDIIGAATPGNGEAGTWAHPPFVHVGTGVAQAPLAAHVGQTRLFDLALDDGDPSPPDAGLSTCTTPLWREGWKVQVRYEITQQSRGDVEVTIAADMRALMKALRVASSWTAQFEHVQVGHRRYTIEEIPGPEGEPLALIAELPMLVRFHA